MSDVDTNPNPSNAQVQTGAPAPGTVDTSTASPPVPADTADGGQPKEGEGQQPDKPSRDRRAEKRIASLTRKNEELLTRLGRLEGLIEAGNGRQPAQVDQAPAKPQPNQFKSYDEYVEALTDWKTEERIRKFETDQRERGRHQADIGKATADAARFAERLMEAGKDIEDFDEVIATITAPDFPGSPTMRDFLEESDHPAHVAQYLADNPREARRIYGMNSAAAVRALEKIEAQVAPKKAPAGSTAPPPVPTVGGRSVTGRDYSKMSPDEYSVGWHERMAKARSS
jgi:hypothetical protein